MLGAYTPFGRREVRVRKKNVVENYYTYIRVSRSVAAEGEDWRRQKKKLAGNVSAADVARASAQTADGKKRVRDNTGSDTRALHRVGRNGAARVPVID